MKRAAPPKSIAPDAPRLSQDLSFAAHPQCCQACGVRAEVTVLSRWQEHDHLDHPEPIIVVLCRPCSDRLISPHPRLYRGLQEHEPWPGAMPICVECRWREGTRCTCPAAKANGGVGVMLRLPQPTVMHLRCSPRSQSGWRTFYPGPVSGCAEFRDEHVKREDVKT